MRRVAVRIRVSQWVLRRSMPVEARWRMVSNNMVLDEESRKEGRGGLGIYLLKNPNGGST